jgi:hypothetical protein
MRVRAEIRFSGGIPATLENWPQGPQGPQLETDGLWHSPSGPSKKTESQETETGPYGNLEIGNELISGIFSEHWNRKLMVTCHFHRPISVFRTETA